MRSKVYIKSSRSNIVIAVLVTLMSTIRVAVASLVFIWKEMLHSITVCNNSADPAQTNYINPNAYKLPNVLKYLGKLMSGVL